MKRIGIIGSTGSIGVNALRVVDAHPEKLKVVAIAANQNIKLLYQQAVKYKPQVVCLIDDSRAPELERKLKPLRIKLVTGLDGLIYASTLKSADQVIFSIVGAIGLKPILSAIRAGKSVAVANKEPLVMAGKLLLREAKKYKAPFLPIDSEHSGLWQCLEGRDKGSVKKLILTSSGGPFLNPSVDLKKVGIKQALTHPKWKMGPKISIDSATLMNKGLEVIEAKNLFDVPTESVDVLVHPEAVVHAIIEFIDGSQLAQMGITDMRLPIQYALSYPGRFYNTLPTLDLTKAGSFHFHKPDLKRFPCLKYGFDAAKIGGTMPAVLNAANEVAVDCFLEGEIQFTEIAKQIHGVMKNHRVIKNPRLNQILDADKWAREEARAYV